jgi:uncharacterized protein
MTSSVDVGLSENSSMEDFRPRLRAYLADNARPQHKFGHQPRLYALTQQIGAGLTYDDDVVCAAAWLHDLGVFVGHRPEDPALLVKWNHVAYTTAKAPDLLRSMGFPEAKIEAVLEVIRTHQPQDVPGSIEATILRDADILEQLGAIGVMRTASKVGNDTRFATFGDALRSLERALEQLPGQVRLESTRALAEPRVATLRAFLAALVDEGQGELD